MKKEWIRLGAAALLFVVALTLPMWLAVPAWLPPALYIVAYLVAGGEVLLNAAKNIAHGKIFDENFLMSVATIGALCIGQYPEAVAVMVFYEIGERFSDYAVDRSRRSIAALMNIRPDTATVRRGDDWVTVPPEQVAVGELIRVRPGDRVPLDGVVVDGRASLDTAALTGESLPREVAVGDTIYSGSIALDGALTLRAEKAFGESTVSRILDLVEHASNKKSSSETFITRFAAVYTPIVLALAVLLAAIPPLVVPGAVFTDWLYRALTFLVVSCPCALVISVPLTFFGGLGGTSRAGVLVKGGNYLEALAKLDTAVFDKTGTLTKGVFEVQALHPVGMDAQRLLLLAAQAESASTHPIAQSLRRACTLPLSADAVTDIREQSGHGVRAVVDGQEVLVGNRKLMEDNGLAVAPPAEIGTVVYVAADGVYAGCVVIADTLKEDAAEAIARLNAMGVRRTVMLTGDTPAVADSVGAQLGLSEVHAGLLPADKVDQVERLLAQLPKGGTLAFVGDGINDAPVLARADVGVAMGGLGADAAIEAADVVIMTDHPGKLAEAVRLARRTVRIAKQNIALALIVKVAVLALCAMGIGTMWEAVFADVGVTLLAVCNALRAIRR